MVRRIYNYFDKKTAPYSSKPYASFQYALLISLLGFFTLIAFSFMLWQLSISHDMIMLTADTTAAVAGLFLLLLLKNSQDIDKVATYTTYFLFFFLLIFSIVNQNHDFGLIWSIFFPAFAILLKGVRFGLIATLLYYLILLSFAYNGIGSWEDGAWTLQAFLRFTGASIGAIFVIAVAEYSRERTFRSLHLMHEKERRNAKKMRDLSNRDHLTGLYNRRKLQELFQQRINSATRDNTCFCFFLLDIDFFKLYNDTYGHQMGDTTLQTVASIMLKNLRRSNDLIFRIGGEEFGGIMIGASKELIEEHLRSILADLTEANIEHSTSSIAGHITASIGAVISQPKQHQYSFDKQFSEADKALYDCKEKGRNCISVITLEQC